MLLEGLLCVSGLEVCSILRLCHCCREVAELQEELAMMDLFQQHAMASRQEQWQHTAYSQAQREQLRDLVRQFLDLPDMYPASLSPLPLTSAGQLREVIYAFKVSRSFGTMRRHTC
jgi:hypothetical protein